MGWVGLVVRSGKGCRVCNEVRERGGGSVRMSGKGWRVRNEVRERGGGSVRMSGKGEGPVVRLGI